MSTRTTIPVLLGAARLPFLVLTPACMVLGLATAWHATAQFELNLFVLALIGALAAHVSVNTFNEYYDFHSGLDHLTARTPFSGGSGVLPANPALASAVLWLALLSLAFTALIGLYFLTLRGAALLPLGLTGLALIYLYTNWLTRHSLLCLLAPGVGFGPLMVAGTHFVLTGTYTVTSWLASLLPLWLASALLLVNQFPDVEADRQIGRRHLPITIGRAACANLYGGLLAATYLTIVGGVVSGYFPLSCLLGLATVVLALPAWLGVRQHADDIAKLVSFLGKNVVVVLLTPVLVAVGFWIA